MKITGLLANDCPNGFDCPKIHDTDGDEVIVQGDTVTDPHVLAELHLPDREGAVTVPRSLIYPGVLSLEEMAEWIGERHTFHLLRIENRSHYTSGSDGGDFQRYLRGEPGPQEGQAWREAIRQDTDEGRVWSKVHVQHGDPSEYERYAYEWGFARTVVAGEQVRVLEAAPGALSDVPDFFVVDRQYVVRSIYDENGRHVGAQVVQGVDAAAYRALAFMLWDGAVDFAPWWAARPQYHRHRPAA